MAMKNVDCVIEIKKGGISLKALEKFYKSLEKHNVTVGIHKAEGSKQVGNNNFTLIKNACIQEFGNTQVVKKSRRFRSPMTGKWFFIKKGTEMTVPARPFVRIFNNSKEKKDLTGAFKNQIEIYSKSNDIKSVYDGVGFLAKARMRERIYGHKIKPANSTMTKEFKGSSTPLYMTGALVSSIKHEVH